MKKLMKNNKLIIGMVHFPPLPGSPEFNDDKDLSKTLKSVIEDIDSLQNNGIDSIMFGNEGDRPYLLKASPESLSAMAYMIGLVKNKIKVPFGVNYLWDPIATIALGSICNANFVREVFTGVYDSDMGLWNPDAAKAIRLRNNLNRNDLNVLFNVNAEFASPLGTRTTSEKAESAVFSSLADGICVSGVITGKSVNIKDLKETKNKLHNTPVFANTGVNIENVEEILSICDGCVIGSSLKYDGVTWNNIDPNRVKKFMEKVDNIRK